MYYIYHHAYYQLPCCQTAAYWPTRQFPSVDPELLNQSANESKKLMNDASIVLDKLANSKQFGTELMDAAQASDNEKVKQLIDSIEGVTSEIRVKYTPDGLQLEFKSKASHSDCCLLKVSLRWR